MLHPKVHIKERLFLKQKSLYAATAVAISAAFIGTASAAEVEVLHYWTSGVPAIFTYAFSLRVGSWVRGRLARRFESWVA